MDKIINLKPQQVTTDEYFGGCPECGKNNGYLNCEKTHVFFCETHKTAWVAGSNLFSSWHSETEADWQRNEERLATYSVVEPIYPEPTEKEREWSRKQDYEREVTDTLGATMIAGSPIDPADPLGLMNEDAPFVHRPDRLYILTSDRVAYDLERAAAYAAFEAHKAGDPEAIGRLLARAT